MKNIHPSFEIFEGKEDDIPGGYQFMKCHMIFDVKFGENFQCKVSGGHMTEMPTTLTYYSSIISRDSVCIALTIAALNGLKVMSYDNQNAYLMADCHKKIWTYVGPKFGSEAGPNMIVKKAC